VWKTDGFVSRSLFDLFSNFTFFLNDPIHGDGIQQHDSRLQEGANTQYTRPYRIGGIQTVFTAGANFHDNQINVGLYSREGRVPLDTTTLAHAHVTNGAGYMQESVSLFNGAVLIGGGLRFDQFRFGVRDLVDPAMSGVEPAGRWQPKASIAWTPSKRAGVKLFANYGRGISTADARGIVQHPESERVATTDFMQSGVSYHSGRFTASASAFLIDRSNEMVYIPDDGSFEFKGPSRAYGYETKLTAHLTRHVEISGGITKVGNAFYRGTYPRVYVDSAPHFVANTDLTLAAWKGWSGSLRMRAINHYRLDGEDPSIVATGHTVIDFGMSRQIRRGVEFNLSVDNLTNRAYYETQNYFESRLQGEDPMFRIHGTPGYSRTIMAGLTFRLFGK
jgi:outer membrane receptor protein involved in Fe transport